MVVPPVLSSTSLVQDGLEVRSVGFRDLELSVNPVSQADILQVRGGHERASPTSIQEGTDTLTLLRVLLGTQELAYG